MFSHIVRYSLILRNRGDVIPQVHVMMALRRLSAHAPSNATLAQIVNAWKVTVRKVIYHNII